MSLNKLLETLISVLDKKQATPFYNEPIFLTLLSILLGGIALTLITKHIEQRSKSREMAIGFLNDTGFMLSSIHAVINGHVKRKDYGKNMNEKAASLKGTLFHERFSIRVKSKAYLKSNNFWRKYDLLIYEIDLLLYIMRSSDDDDLTKYFKIIDERIQLLDENWKTTDLQVSEHKSSYIKGKTKYGKTLRESPEDNDYHKSIVKWADMLWLRSNILIYDALEKSM